MENLQFELENIDDISIGLEKTKQQLKSQQDAYLDNMMYVDLGLPSKNIWAGFNAGVNIDKLIEKQYDKGKQFKVNPDDMRFTHIHDMSIYVSNDKYYSKYIAPTLDDINELLNNCNISILHNHFSKITYNDFKFNIGSKFLKLTSKTNGKELLFPAEIDYENCDRPFSRNKVTTFLVDNPNAIELYLYILENNEYFAYRLTYSSKDDKVHLCKCINENFEIIGVYNCYYRPLLKR